MFMLHQTVMIDIIVIVVILEFILVRVTVMYADYLYIYF